MVKRRETELNSARPSSLPKWDLFLSHAGDDLHLAIQVKEALEADGAGRKLLVWLDDTAIPIGGSIPKHVEEGLRNSARFGLLMTRQYFESHSGWADAEWHAALHRDPDNRASSLLPILAGDCDVPALLSHLRRVDLRDLNRFTRAITQIAAALRGEVLDEAGSHCVTIASAAPDNVRETLASNVFLVENLPDRCFSAEVSPHLLSRTTAHTSKETFELRLQVPRGMRLPPYHLDGRRIVAFTDFSDPSSPLRSAIVQSSVQPIAVTSDKLTAAARRSLVALLNTAIDQHLNQNSALARLAETSRFFYRPMESHGLRTVTWPTGKRMATRTVAKPYIDAKTGEVRYWLHHGAGMRFTQLGSTYAFEIEPTYVLTEDGTTPVGGPIVARVVNRWTAPERNMQIFRNVMFWRWTLTSLIPSIDTGGKPLFMAPSPIEFQVRSGLASDHTDMTRAIETLEGDDDLGLSDSAGVANEEDPEEQ